MLKKKVCLMVAFAGSTLFAGASLADSMRCGTDLVSSGHRHGNGKYEVLKKCGEPTARMGNVWIYDRGRSTREVHFDDAGRIISIR